MTRILLFTKCLTFDKIPTVFDSFKQSSLFNVFSMLSWHQKLHLKYLVESTCLTHTSSILILND